jgi:hypothetical protein
MMTKQHEALDAFELTDELKTQLKEQYGRLYEVPVAGMKFVIHPLMRNEWEVITDMYQSNDKITQTQIDDKVTDLGLVGPRADGSKGGWAALPAGITQTLSLFIRAKSGFYIADLPGGSDINVEQLTPSVKMPMPSDEEIERIKKACPFVPRLITIGGDNYVVRPVTRAEWKAITEATVNDPDARTLETTKRVVQWPKNVDWDTRLAGCAETIAEYALSISGYGAPEQVKEL